MRPQCRWCIAKRECDGADVAARFNAQVRHFNAALDNLETAREGALDGCGQETSFTYELERYLLVRAAQSWMLSHPPNPTWAIAAAPHGYPPFCRSRLLHFKCDNLDVSPLSAAHPTVTHGH